MHYKTALNGTLHLVPLDPVIPGAVIRLLDENSITRAASMQSPCVKIDGRLCSSRPAANDVLDAWMELVGVPVICPSSAREPDCRLYFVELRPEHQQVNRTCERTFQSARSCLARATQVDRARQQWTMR